MNDKTSNMRKLMSTDNCILDIWLLYIFKERVMNITCQEGKDKMIKTNQHCVLPENIALITSTKIHTQKRAVSCLWA